MGKLSREKGKAGELAACAYLRSLGFESARRTVQYQGRGSAGDVVCPVELPYIHLEVKVGRQCRMGPWIGGVMARAERECQPGMVPVVLWRMAGSPTWLLTWIDAHDAAATVFSEESIARTLRRLNTDAAEAMLRDADHSDLRDEIDEDDIRKAAKEA